MVYLCSLLELSDLDQLQEEPSLIVSIHLNRGYAGRFKYLVPAFACKMIMHATQSLVCGLQVALLLTMRCPFLATEACDPNGDAGRYT